MPYRSFLMTRAGAAALLSTAAMCLFAYASIADHMFASQPFSDAPLAIAPMFYGAFGLM